MTVPDIRHRGWGGLVSHPAGYCRLPSQKRWDLNWLGFKDKTVAFLLQAEATPDNYCWLSTGYVLRASRSPPSWPSPEPWDSVRSFHKRRDCKFEIRSQHQSMGAQEVKPNVQNFLSLVTAESWLCRIFAKWSVCFVSDIDSNFQGIWGWGQWDSLMDSNFIVVK